MLLIEQRQRGVTIEHHELVGLGDDLRLQPTLEMRGVHRLAHQAKEISVAHHPREHALIEQVDELGVHAALGEREEGVEEVPARLVEIDHRTRVRHPLLLVVEPAGTVERLLHEAEPIGLEQISPLGVDHQAANHHLRIEGELLLFDVLAGIEPRPDEEQDRRRLRGLIGKFEPDADGEIEL